MNNIKKILISGFVIVSFAGYFLYEKFLKGDAKEIMQKPPSLVLPSTSVPVSVSGNYRDGEYVGDLSDAFYGNVQVKAVVKGGRLSDVVFLDFPRDRGTSIEISNLSMPILRSEAIRVQSANVDIVSGATQTSMAFIESLKSALNKAKI
jgi:uncharacterized protein with FMN-binding domain